MGCADAPLSVQSEKPRVKLCVEPSL